MGWIPQYRYKILGKLSKSNGEYIFVFDLQATETYERAMTSEGKKKSAKITYKIMGTWQGNNRGYVYRTLKRPTYK